MFMQLAACQPTGHRTVALLGLIVLLVLIGVLLLALASLRRTERILG
jgi:hypothetical protein